MSNYRLTLRTVNSGFPTPFQDITLGSVLSHQQLDNNFVTIKGNLIHTGTTSGTDLILHKINGETIPIDLTSVVDSADTFITGGTLSGDTLILENNDGDSVSVSLSGLNDTYIHKYTLFVDPNGDDNTAEFGNRQKPYKTLLAALSAATTFMGSHDLPSQWNNFFPSDPTGTGVVVPFLLGEFEAQATIKYEIPKVEIEVFPGLYIAGTELPNTNYPTSIDNPVNLLYNGIIWNFHKGAIMIDYVWDDTWNSVDSVSGDRPVICDVIGEGTFLTSPAQLLEGNGFMYINNYGTNFNFNANISRYNPTVNNGLVNYNVRRYIVGNIDFGAAINIESGTLNLKADLVQWILPTKDFVSTLYRLCYQGGGKLNLDINKYNAIYTSVVDGTLPGYADLAFINMISTYVESGSPDPNFGDWLLAVFGEEINYPQEYYELGSNGYAPSLGYFEEYDPTVKPTTTNININYGKFEGYAINYDGGILTYNTILSEINAAYIFKAYPESIFLYSGGPYYDDSRLKISLLGGKIKSVCNFYVLEGIVSSLIEVYDNGPQIYVNNVRYVVSERINTIYAFNIDKSSVNNYQEFSLILDSVKIMSEEPNLPSGYFYNFYTLNNGDPTPIKIYGNCFSNLPEVYLVGGDSVTNLIPSTNLIIDSNIQII